MNKLKTLWRKYKYSQESLYTYGNLKNREQFIRAMRFYRLKTAIEVGICILVAQIIILVMLGLV